MKARKLYLLFYIIIYSLLIGCGEGGFFEYNSKKDVHNLIYVKGFIVDSENKDSGVSGVILTTDRMVTRSVETVSGGGFAFEAPKGEYRMEITANKKGWESITFSVHVNKGLHNVSAGRHEMKKKNE